MTRRRSACNAKQGANCLECASYVACSGACPRGWAQGVHLVHGCSGGGHRKSSRRHVFNSRNVALCLQAKALPLALLETTGVACRPRRR